PPIDADIILIVLLELFATTLTGDYCGIDELDLVVSFALVISNESTHE
ncbi:16047_t:CDS:1, partial [Funneliformis geosporum]